MERDWKSINNRLVQQGTILVDLRFLEKRKAELASMNVGKQGAPFEYPNIFVIYAGTVRCMFRLSKIYFKINQRRVGYVPELVCHTVLKSHVLSGGDEEKKK